MTRQSKFKWLILVAGLAIFGELPATFAADSEDAFWKSVTKGNVVEEYEIYLKQYPKGRHAGEARRRIAQLEGSAIAKQQAEKEESRLADANENYRVGSAAFDRKEYELALPFIRKSAEQGNASGQDNLGTMYQKGLGGLAKNDAEAVRWYRKSAEQGNASGQAHLGFMYELGLGGLTKDDAEAVRWYRKSADQGNPLGQYNLGTMYQNGQGGLTNDEAEAVRWYRKSAEQGNAWGQYMLGTMYQNGQGGLTKDDAEAVRWYQKSAEQGNAFGKNRLGTMHQLGHGGLAKDDAEAVRWFRKSAEQGNVTRRRNQRIFTDQQTPADFGMGLHHLILFAGQRVRLEQDGIGNANFSDIVHRCTDREHFPHVLGQAQRLGDGIGVMRHAHDVHAGFVVAVLRSGTQATNRIGPRIFQFNFANTQRFIDHAARNQQRNRLRQIGHELDLDRIRLPAWRNEQQQTTNRFAFIGERQDEARRSIISAGN